ncbi:MAG: CDP-diacylglycerol--serine O-phosphatidyltransferase, partial [Syntrophomonadaceae bacterium]|nr:CDP-diacylglycerol--serine O-phosphatidyltransferase [Syntrophomonadaceae bacterium]
AALMDGLDGKVARYFNTSSELGKQLDSLSDLVSFGIAPSLLILSQVNTGGIFVPMLIVYLIYICCGAYRLARFNTMHITKYFQGIPITAAGILVALYSLATLPNYRVFTIIFMLLLSILMVSKIKIPKI